MSAPLAAGSLLDMTPSISVPAGMIQSTDRIHSLAFTTSASIIPFTSRFFSGDDPGFASYPLASISTCGQRFGGPVYQLSMHICVLVSVCL